MLAQLLDTCSNLPVLGPTTAWRHWRKGGPPSEDSSVPCAPFHVSINSAADLQAQNDCGIGSTLLVVERLTALDVITLVLAITGTVTGVAALGWSVATHYLTGPRVKVTLRAGWRSASGSATVPIASFLTISRSELFPEAVIGVVVNNSGRSPVHVTTWYLNVGSARIGGSHEDGPLPYLLGPGEEHTWWVNLNDVKILLRIVSRADKDVALAGTVGLGTGGSVQSNSYDPKVVGFQRAA